MGWYQGEVPPGVRRVAVTGGEYYLYGTVQVGGDVQIGRFTYLGEGGRIAARSAVRIGSFCSIAANFHLATHAEATSGTPINFPLNDVLGLDCAAGSELPTLDAPALLGDRPVSIGHDVWIGEGVSVLGGARIADGCVVGAKSVVRGETVPYGVYVGNPARLLRLRFPQDVVEALRRVRWWDWSVEKIEANAAFFGTDLTRYEGSVEALVVEPEWSGARAA